MIRCEFMTNLDLVLSTMKHGKVWKFVSDDTVNKEDFTVSLIDRDDFFAVGIYLENEFMGCFCFMDNGESAEIHTCLLPSAWGMAETFGKCAVRHVFANCDYKEITTFIPITNKLAKALAIKCGFVYKEQGNSLIVGGVDIPTDIYILERSKCQ